MGKLLEQVAQAVAQLPQHQRLALAGLILASDHPAEPESEAAWEKEIKARIEAIDSGKIDGFSSGEVMREADKRLAS